MGKRACHLAHVNELRGALGLFHLPGDGLAIDVRSRHVVRRQKLRFALVNPRDVFHMNGVPAIALLVVNVIGIGRDFV